MTLVIALSCKDGIVMASDGQATVSSSGGPIKAEAEKIFAVNNTTLFGASGKIGHIQKGLRIIKNTKNLEKDLTPAVMKKIKQNLFRLYHDDLQRHVAFYKTIPNKMSPPPIADILLTKVQENGENIIWHIAPDCSDELLHDLGYACTGSGDVFAYTLLKEFDVKSMGLEETKLIAFNTIRLGIEVGAYGLGEPIYIWTISRDGEKTKTKKLAEKEIMALKDSWLSWKKAQRELFKRIDLKQTKDE